MKSGVIENLGLFIYLETRRLHFFLCLVLLVAGFLSYLLLVSLCPSVLFFFSHGAPSFRIVLWGLSEGILLGFLLLQQPGQAVGGVPCLLNNSSQNRCSSFSKTQKVSSLQTAD